jgi:thiol-disulfide isomerase/thioredoxin
MRPLNGVKNIKHLNSKHYTWLIFRLALISLAVLTLSACNPSQAPLKVKIGQVVPPLPVKDLANLPVKLKPEPGKLLMINVWATWCSACRQEMPSLQRLANRFSDKGLKLVGLSVDHDEHLVREYLIENKIHFPVLLDRSFATVNGLFGVRVFPSTFILGPDGTLLKVIEGWREWDSPKIQATIQNLLPANHSESHQES